FPFQNASQAMQSASAAANPFAVNIRDYQTSADPTQFACVLALAQLEFVRSRLLFIGRSDDQIVPRSRSRHGMELRAVSEIMERRTRSQRLPALSREPDTDRGS